MIERKYMTLSESAAYLGCDDGAFREILFSLENREEMIRAALEENGARNLPVIRGYVEFSDCPLLTNEDLPADMKVGTGVAGPHLDLQYEVIGPNAEFPLKHLSVTGRLPVAQLCLTKLLVDSEPQLVTYEIPYKESTLCSMYRMRRVGLLKRPVARRGFPYFITGDMLRFFKYELDEWKGAYQALNADASTQAPAEIRVPKGAHISNRLAILNQCADRFWANADRDDRATHPTNAQVSSWLIERGFSESLADKAASIIRPEWAPAGRKPDE